MIRVNTTTDYSPSNFIRTGGSVSFEERAVQPSDFTDTYAKEYAKDPELFRFHYPQWQDYADCFTMRRAVVSISGRQRCVSVQFKADDLKTYMDPGFVKVKNFAIPGTRKSTIPSGKYLLTSFSFSDSGEGYTDLNVTYQQYGPWELIQLRDPPELKKQE